MVMHKDSQYLTEHLKQKHYTLLMQCQVNVAKIRWHQSGM